MARRGLHPVAIGIFPGKNLFAATLIESPLAPIYSHAPGTRCATKEAGEMEKWLVVSGIWMMCALCAVLFIRGASCSAAKRMEPARINTGTESPAKDMS
jgi:hypothetical protein